MKTSLFLGTTLGLVLLAAGASAATTNYTVTLNGAQEIPAVSTNATGTGTLVFDDEAKEISGTITFTNLSGSNAAHIHKGACGVSGGVEIALTADNSAIDVTETLTDAQITALMAGELYVNIHTGAHGDGEIRGQILAQGAAACGAGGADGGSSSGSTTDGGSTSSSSSGGSSTSSSSGATTERSDGGTSSGSAAPAEDDGCSTTGSAPGSGLAIAFGVGAAIAAISRNRRKR